MSVTIQLRGDSAANWASTNPVLHQREIGVETDTGKAKMGDGATAWNSLAYWQPSGADTDAFLPLAGGTMSGPIAMGGSKVTGMGNGAASGDGVAFGQLGSAAFQASSAFDTAGAAAAAQANAEAYSSPTTALGDTVYGGASGTPTRLPGNTIATRKFLRQTGTGSASAAPAWDTLQSGDIPDISSRLPFTSVAAPTGIAATDQANIQAALNSAAIVIFPDPGTAQWLVAGDLKIPDRTKVMGPAWHAQTPIIKLEDNSGATCVFGSAPYLDNTTAAGYPIEVRDLTIDCNGAANATTHGIVFMNFNSAIEHNYLVNPGGCGIIQSDQNSAGTAISNTQVENRICGNKIAWTAASGAVAGQYGIWVTDYTGSSTPANTDGYLEDNIIYGSGDWAVRVERAAGWFIFRNHAYELPQSAFYLDKVWDTFYASNEADIWGMAGGASTYYGHYLYNITTGREGSLHDNQSSTPEADASSTYVYYYVRCPNVTVGVDFHDNFAHRDSGAGAASLAYSFVASTGGAMTVYGAGNHLDGPAAAFEVSGGGTVTFADAAPGTALAATAAIGGDAPATGAFTMDPTAVNSIGIALTSGTVYFTYFTAPRTETVTQVIFPTGNTAAGATPTTVEWGLFTVDASGNLTQVAATVNDTTLYSAGYAKDAAALAASYQTVAGQRYALGLLVVSTAAMPTACGNDATSALSWNGPVRKMSTLTGQTAMPASVTAASLAWGTSAPLLAYVSP